MLVDDVRALPAHRSHAGCTLTFDELVGAYYTAFLAFAAQLTRVDSEDLVHDAIASAKKNWETFDGNVAQARQWFYTTIYNKFVDRYRNSKKRARLMEARIAEATENVHGAGVYGALTRYGNKQGDVYYEPDLAIPAATAHDVGDEVASAIARLEPNLRRVVEMADLQGMQYREIAEVLGVPRGTVQSALFRARRELGLQLRAYAKREYRIESRARVGAAAAKAAERPEHQTDRVDRVVGQHHARALAVV